MTTFNFQILFTIKMPLTIDNIAISLTSNKYFNRVWGRDWRTEPWRPQSRTWFPHKWSL